MKIFFSWNYLLHYLFIFYINILLKINEYIWITPSNVKHSPGLMPIDTLSTATIGFEQQPLIYTFLILLTKTEYLETGCLSTSCVSTWTSSS